MKKMKILLLHDGTEAMPETDANGRSPVTSEFSTEIPVFRALKNLGHDVRTMSFYDDVTPVLSEVNEFRPDVVFNLAEACLGEYRYDKNIPSFLELLRVPYTGCGSVGLMICNNKALTKKILSFHSIKVPRFCVYRVGETVKFPAVFSPPFFIKPLCEEASACITRDSFAANEKDAAERVRFIHERFGKDVIVEEYIDGRELYVGVYGIESVKVLPVWEMKFGAMPDDEPKIATYKAKWDDSYRKKWGIRNEQAASLPEGIEEKIRHICKIAYRVLHIDGYARFDLRLTAEGEVFIIEANANPELAKGEDFAASAEKSGIGYDELIERIIRLAFQRKES